MAASAGSVPAISGQATCKACSGAAARKETVLQQFRRGTGNPAAASIRQLYVQPAFAILHQAEFEPCVERFFESGLEGDAVALSAHYLAFQNHS